MAGEWPRRETVVSRWVAAGPRDPGAPSGDAGWAPPASLGTHGTPRKDPSRSPSDPEPTSPAARGPPSILLHGTSRPLVNLVLYALADEGSARFHWLDVRSDPGPTPELDPVGLGWLPPDRAWAVDQFHGLAPDHARANAAIFELIRPDEPPALLDRLTTFLRLPPTIQRILGEMGPAGEPNLLAVANADRIAESFPGPTIDPILEAFESIGCSLFIGFTSARAPTVPSFGRVLRVEGSSPAGWRDARIVLEHGPAWGRLHPTVPVKLVDLPAAARTLRRAVGN